jgi:hypothetical protein
MSIINSSTTGHSPKAERKFSKKLFIGLGVAIAIAFVAVMLTSQKTDLKANPTTDQLPVEAQPKPKQ